MKETAKKLSWFLGKYMVPLMLVMVVIGYLFPWRNIPHQTLLMVVTFSVISFLSSTSISVSSFITQFKKPFLSLYSIMLVHLACPVVAWTLGVIFFPGDFDVRIGFLISACVPMGAASLVWTAMSGGNVSLSILTLSIEAVAAPAIMPLCLWLVLGESVKLNYVSMIIQLLFMITIPSIIGMWVRDYAGEEKINCVSDYLNLVSKFLMIMIVYINCSSSFQGFVVDWSVLKLILVIFLYVLCNYIVGYIGMSVMKSRSWQDRVSALFSCGLRNNGFAMTIAVAYFNPRVGIPLALSVIVQQPFAGAVSFFLIKQKAKKNALEENEADWVGQYKRMNR